jgi:hypothetical protein
MIAKLKENIQINNDNVFILTNYGKYGKTIEKTQFF